MTNKQLFEIGKKGKKRIRQMFPEFLLSLLNLCKSAQSADDHLRDLCVLYSEE